MIGLRYLSRQDGLAAGASDWAAAVADIRAAVALLSAGDAGMEAESAMAMGGDPRNKAYGLPAWLGGGIDAAGLKWAVHRAEASGGVPAITSATFVNRLSDGRPIGIVESALLTRMRTAAVTAIVMEAMLPALPTAVAVIGAGEQATAHLDMLRVLFPGTTDIRLWNRDRARRDALVAAAASAGGPPVRACARIEDAIDGTQAVLTCTSAPQPLIGARAVRPGRLIVQIGYHEVEFDAIEASDFVAVDLWGAFAERSAKSLFQMYRAGRFTPDRVAADLPGLLVKGRRPPPNAALYFSSFGLNLFDIALAARLLRHAGHKNIGHVLPFL